MPSDSPDLGLPAAAAVPGLGSACILLLAGGCGPGCTPSCFDVYLSSSQAFCPRIQTFLYLIAPTRFEINHKKWCECLAKLQEDCGWVPAKESGWGGYKFPMISCVTWSHRELAAGPTDKSSCPNLPPAFCSSSGLFTHLGGGQMLLTCTPAFLHRLANKALRKTCVILPKAFKHRTV